MTSKLDIIVIGATGFTGRLTCRYLARKAELKGRWGMGGRSEAKLKALKEELGVDVPTFVVDADKPATVDAACARAACVIACAGPFTKVGMPVVDACVRNGTHYVDSAGEFPFVRETIEKHGEAAVKKGVTIVSCCGFNSTTADLGNYVVHRDAGEELKSVHAYFDLKMVGFSNGTTHSIASSFEATTKEDSSPLSLVAKDAVQPSSTPMRLGVWYENGRFTGFSFTAMGDERIVRRTNSLLRSSAVYVQASQGSFGEVLSSTLGMYGTGMKLAIGPLRRRALRNHQTTSVGPSDEAMAKSSFRCSFIGETVSGKRVETTVAAKEDIYTATAIYLSECALSALTLSRKNHLKSGVLTPAYAFGDELVQRCCSAGIAIDTATLGLQAKC